LLSWGTAARAAEPAPGAPSRTLEFRFTPAARSQLALWLEKADGTYLQTVRLTQAVSTRGIGNRPGATQMNSGFHWPYGRREGALPVWAHRRAAAPGAAQWNRVIFQDRASEGFASRTSDDSTIEDYFCLSFTVETTRRNTLDAVTCASAFLSDKGRFLRPDDIARGYAEPMEVAPRVGMMRTLDLVSLYPPRRDTTACPKGDACADHPDVALYVDHARQVMPEIDAVSMATPSGCAGADCAGKEQLVLFTVPADWPAGDYVAWIEVNVEGDHNPAFSGDDETGQYPTPQFPDQSWDSWAIGYGYPYRGQPSVVYRVPFVLGVSRAFATTTAAGYGSVDGIGPDAGTLRPMDDKISDDPRGAPGSGADRLRLTSLAGDLDLCSRSPAGETEAKARFQVRMRDVELCSGSWVPAAPTGVATTPVTNEKHSHQWGVLRFVVPSSERAIANYEVRYSTKPITLGDPQTFAQAMPAVAATGESEALVVPVCEAPGSTVEVSFGGMIAATRYWVAIRAVDACNVAGPYAVAEIETTRQKFTQLSGCFVATAAYGSALEPQVGALRTVRDALRPRSVFAAAATDLYYQAGPAAAELVGRSETARAVVRTLLGPLADAAAAVAPLLK
jgi:hypothetical protein